MTVPLPAFALGLLLSTADPVPGFTPADLWAAWPSHRFVTVAAPCLRPADLAERLRAFEARHRGRLAVEEVGRSVEGRPIHLLTVGSGPRRLLLWSQMHGDEPSATPALFDVVDFLLSSRDPEAEAVLKGTTLLIVPMLNPDGAERYARRNGQAIDVNRDALQLASPEGTLLKALRDRFQPELGFNLHDQDRRTTVGDTGVLATVALLAVAGDAQGTLTPGRARAKRVCAAVVAALGPFVPGGISRYDEDWNPRAFGDNLTAWGTPIVLIESGGVPPGRPLEEPTRLDFVALLSVLVGLVRDDLQGVDPLPYESLRRNQEGQWVDVLVGGGQIWQAPAAAPYRADLGFDVLDDDRVRAGCAAAPSGGPSRVREVGDGRLLGAARRVEASGRLLVPGLAASVRGLATRGWLTPEALPALARLGVTRLRWHVAPRERAKAQEAAQALGGPGRPAIELVGAEAPGCLLEIPGRPAAPASTSLEAALDALTGRGWRTRAGTRGLSLLLGELAGLPAGASVAPALAPGAAASFLLLRPRAAGALEPAALDVEAVFVDGRPARGVE